MATFEELMAKSRELNAAGDIDGAKRVARIAVDRRNTTPAALAEPAQFAPNGVPMNASAKAELASMAKAGSLTPGLISPDVARAESLGARAISGVDNPGAFGAFMGNLAPGLTFGFADEIAAGIGSAFGKRSYDETLTGLRAQQEAMGESSPVASTLGEVAGGVAGAFTGLGLASKGIGLTARAAPRLGLAMGLPRLGLASGGLAARAAAGAGIGAVEGGLYGFGTGEGGFQNRMEGAGMGAALGGALGGALPAVTAGIRYVGDKVGGLASSALNLKSDLRASRAIDELIRRSGMSADDASVALRRAGDQGQPEMVLADALGTSGQRGLAGVTRQPGDARQAVTDALMKRQDNQGNRVSAFLADALDAPDTAMAREASMKAARGQAADVAYSSAREGAGPVDVRTALATIDDRIGGMTGSGVTGDGIDATLGKYRGRLAAQPGPDGVMRELSDFDRVLGVKQDLSDEIGKAVRGGENNKARELKKLSDALDASLEASSPNYRAANDGFAKASREIGAIDKGSAAVSGRVRSADTLAQIGKMSPEEVTAYRAGYADPLIAKVESSAPGVNKVRPLLDDKRTAELGALANDPALLSDRLRRENTMFETNVAALGGSKTADNLADVADNAMMSSSVIGNIASGRWGAAGGQLADRAMAAWSGSSPQTRAMIADILMSKDPQKAVAVAKKREVIGNTTSAIIEALIRSGARVTSQ